jgi:capsular exopolysaccharide synthesis family protein
MELRHYLNLIWKWMWLVVLSVVVAAGSSYLASKAATPLYRTKTTLMVGRITENPELSSIDVYTGQQLTYTYTQLVRRQPVLQGVIDSLGLNMSWQALANQVSSNIVQQTMLIEISVVDTDPYRAAVLADAIGQQLIQHSSTSASANSPEEVNFIQSQLADLQNKIEDAEDEITRLSQEMDAASSARQIQDLQNQITILETKISGWQYTYTQYRISLQGGDANALSVIEPASINPVPISPNVRMNVLMAAAIGMVLAIGGAILIEYLDDTVKTAEDVNRVTGLAMIGAIPRINGDDYPNKLVAASQPLSPIAEAFRVLRTNLQFSAVDDPPKSVMVTSPSPSEGKSITLANLAVVIAQSGVRVILVDTDLRRPVLHRIFNLPNRNGFSDAILSQEGEFEKYLQTTQVENLLLLSSGSLPPNPAELLASQRMKELIETLERSADLVLFDSPPVLVVTDAAVLGASVDGVVFVNDAGRSRSNDVRRGMEELKRVRANILGVVLNRMNARGAGYYYYYYSDEDNERVRKKRQHNWLVRHIPWFFQQSGKVK